MKKILRIFLLCGFIALNSPVNAQNPNNPATTTTDRDNDDDDEGKWGLTGLLGLLGLIGLKRRDDDRVRTTTVNR